MTLYYEDKNVRLYHGDCFDILRQPFECDHVITDPPYSERTTTGARSRVGERGAGIDKAERIAVNYLEGQWDSMSGDALRAIITRSGVRRWVVSFMDWRHTAELEKKPPVGLRFVRAGVWVKPNGAPQFTGDRPGMGWESVAIMHHGSGKMRWNGGGARGVWTENKINGEHPTQKPLVLLNRLIQQFTDPGELILDPFAGSGTTLVSAKLLGRCAVGIEMEERWCEVAAKRLSQGVLPLDGS